MTISQLSDLKQFGFECESLDLVAPVLFKKLLDKYGQPSCGRHRATFMSNHCVIKFPLNMKGLSDNAYEFRSKDETNAKTKLIDIDGLTCSVQEKLRMPTADEYKNLPSWTDFVDCQQVGFDKKGNLKAYDFGYF